MSEMTGSRTLTPGDVYNRVTVTLNRAAQTLNAVKNSPLTASETADKAFALDDEVNAMFSEVNAWWNEFASGERTVEVQLETLRRRYNLDEIDAEQNNREGTQLHEQLLAARNATRTLRETPGRLIPDFLTRAQNLADQVRAVYAESQGVALEQRSGETIEANRTELRVGLRVHHRQASASLCLLWVWSGIAGFLVLLLMFFEPILCGSMPDFCNRTPSITHQAAQFSGRFAILLGAGWVLVFVGRLQSRHNQQMVSYRDRLALLDAVELVLKSGVAPSSKEHAVAALIETCASSDQNAFRATAVKERSAEREVEDAVKIADPILRRIRPVLKDLKALSE